MNTKPLDVRGAAFSSLKKTLSIPLLEGVFSSVSSSRMSTTSGSLPARLLVKFVDFLTILGEFVSLDDRYFLLFVLCVSSLDMF